MGARTLDLLAHDHRFQLVAALTRQTDPRLGQRFQIGSNTVSITDTTDAPCRPQRSDEAHRTTGVRGTISRSNVRPIKKALTAVI